MYGRLVVVGTLAMSAAIVGCAPSVPAPTLTAPLPAATGAIVGGIYRCFALSGPPTRVAGSVDVFAGDHLTANQPTTVQSVVAEGGTYTFILPPGKYVLIGHWAGSNLSPPMVTVTVTSGQITRQDLDYQGCM
jgi:hypothetical protein